LLNSGYYQKISFLKVFRNIFFFFIFKRTSILQLYNRKLSFINDEERMGFFRLFGKKKHSLHIKGHRVEKDEKKDKKILSLIRKQTKMIRYVNMRN